MSINVNSRIDFVFAQKNAAHCIGEQNKKGDKDKHRWLSLKNKTKLIVWGF